MNKNSRNYSIDLLKFISMLGIIIVHITGRGGLINSSVNNILTINIYRTINNVFLVSVNIFCLITGYLYINKSKIRYRNIVEIILSMVFYSIIITAIFYGLNLYDVRDMGIKYLINSLFPSMVGRYWFITCYIFLFFMIPYINKFLLAISKENFKKLLITVFVFFCIFEEIGLYDFFRIEWGYSPFWLIYLYMVGSYIKMYDLKISNKKSIIVLISCMSLNTLIMLLTKNLLKSSSIFYNICNNFNSPLLVISSIEIFNLFTKLRVNNNIFSRLGKYSLAVIILHGHRLIYDWVINGNMKFIKPFNFVIELLFLFGGAFLIYMVCVLIEFIKRKIFKLIKIDSLIDFIGQKLDNIYR